MDRSLRPMDGMAVFAALGGVNQNSAGAASNAPEARREVTHGKLPEPLQKNPSRPQQNYGLHHQRGRVPSPYWAIH